MEYQSYIIIRSRDGELTVSISDIKNSSFIFKFIVNDNIKNIHINEYSDILRGILNLSGNLKYPITNDIKEYLIKEHKYYEIELSNIKDKKVNSKFFKQILHAGIKDNIHTTVTNIFHKNTFNNCNFKLLDIQILVSSKNLKLDEIPNVKISVIIGKINVNVYANCIEITREPKYEVINNTTTKFYTTGALIKYSFDFESKIKYLNIKDDIVTGCIFDVIENERMECQITILENYKNYNTYNYTIDDVIYNFTVETK